MIQQLCKDILSALPHRATVASTQISGSDERTDRSTVSVRSHSSRTNHQRSATSLSPSTPRHSAPFHFNRCSRHTTSTPPVDAACSAAVKAVTRHILGTQLLNYSITFVYFWPAFCPFCHAAINED